ncbi:MRP-L47-domain-containing protein, partial [Piedraia hortae CBS 480.64]
NLPTPAHPPKESSPTDPSHGLWSFFPPPRTLPLTPETLQQHGGAWSAALLRPKSWSDLHSLYWVCVRERNMLYTSEGERERLIKGEGYGKYEFEVRVSQVEKTMERIRGVLRERYYAWQEGRGEAMRDDEVDL